MNDRLKEVLQQLYELRDQLHGDANARAREKIDEAIRKLEAISRESHTDRQIEQLCLQALGAVIRCCPAIIRLLSNIDP